MLYIHVIVEQIHTNTNFYGHLTRMSQLYRTISNHALFRVSWTHPVFEKEPGASRLVSRMLAVPWRYEIAKVCKSELKHAIELILLSFLDVFLESYVKATITLIWNILLIVNFTVVWCVEFLQGKAKLIHDFWY